MHIEELSFCIWDAPVLYNYVQDIKEKIMDENSKLFHLWPKQAISAIQFPYKPGFDVLSMKCIFWMCNSCPKYMPPEEESKLGLDDLFISFYAYEKVQDVLYMLVSWKPMPSTVNHVQIWKNSWQERTTCQAQNERK